MRFEKTFARDILHQKNEKGEYYRERMASEEQEALRPDEQGLVQCGKCGQMWGSVGKLWSWINTMWKMGLPVLCRL